MVIAETDALKLLKDVDAFALLQAVTDANILIRTVLEAGPALKFTHQLLQECYACRVLLAALEHDEQNNTNTHFTHPLYSSCLLLYNQIIESQSHRGRTRHLNPLPTKPLFSSLIKTGITGTPH
jgi:hypothetical protein